MKVPVFSEQINIDCIVCMFVQGRKTLSLVILSIFVFFKIWTNGYFLSDFRLFFSTILSVNKGGLLLSGAPLSGYQI